VDYTWVLDDQDSESEKDEEDAPISKELEIQWILDDPINNIETDRNDDLSVNKEDFTWVLDDPVSEIGYDEEDIHTRMDIDYRWILDDPASEEEATLGSLSDGDDQRNDKHQRRNPCSCKQKKCYSKFNVIELDEIHKTFWNKDKNDRRQWIYDHVIQTRTKRRYVKANDSPSKRKFSRKYMFPQKK
ncbi:unnamed protein product, partial [Meganyctiphanes norvegica]